MSDHLLSLSFSLSNVRTTTFREGFPDIFVLANISSTCVIVQVLATVAGECKTESSKTRERALFPSSPSIFLFFLRSCFLCSRARHESTQVGRADTSERWERRRGERVPQSQSV